MENQNVFLEKDVENAAILTSSNGAYECIFVQFTDKSSIHTTFEKLLKIVLADKMSEHNKELFQRALSK